MVACFRPSLSWTYVIELVFMNHDKILAVKYCRENGKPTEHVLLHRH